jgi:DNA polymerase-3 subunit delta'
MAAASTLPGTESQPHAAAVLGPALPPHGQPSHAYLFHGPPGSGKRASARSFATALLADGVGADGGLERVARRVQRETHPDLTWVRPTGAAEMLVADVDEPVVAAAARTPFEASRRVFVIEDADKMNERAANRLLKTLEEPPHFAYLILLASRWQDVLPTIVSRCQLVRFDPLSPAAIERRLLAGDRARDAAATEVAAATEDAAAFEVAAASEVAAAIEMAAAAQVADRNDSLTPARAAACARLALGDADLARRLAGPEGEQLRAAARALVAAVLGQSQLAISKPWSALLSAAAGAGELAGEQVTAAVAAELELLPRKERRRREREGVDAARRAQRRQRTRALDLGLRLVELWLRDMLCLAEGVRELVHAQDATDALEADLAALQAQGVGSRALPAAIELVGRTRLDLTQNVSEELALEALSYRLQSAIGPRSGVRS